MTNTNQLCRWVPISEVDLSKLDLKTIYDVKTVSAGTASWIGLHILDFTEELTHISFPLSIPEQVSDEKLFQMACDYLRQDQIEHGEMNPVVTRIANNYIYKGLVYMRDRMLPLLYKQPEVKPQNVSTKQVISMSDTGLRRHTIDTAIEPKGEEGWISVTKRLPTKEDADENGKVLIHRVMNAGQAPLSKSIFDWYMVKNCDKDTHWQPLPKPPVFTDNKQGK